MTIIQLRDETKLVRNLVSDTVTLMHSTVSVPAIKILVTAHDILDLTVYLHERFLQVSGFLVWDQAALSDLDGIRSELVGKHALTFSSPGQVRRFYDRVGTLLVRANPQGKFN